MTDKKISQLTTASTPLSGTEVLPIVQGGNTVKVPVSDLTAGRAIATGAVTSTVADNGGNIIKQSGASQTGYLNFQDSDGTNAGRIKYDHFSNALQFIANETEYVRIKSNGDTAINVGNIELASGKGIDFSANSHAAGMTSELLDDYEEGTATLGFAFGGGTEGITYGGRPVGYIKVGSMVTVTGYIALSSKGTSTGSATITGLPFTVASSANGGYSTISLSVSNMSFVGQYSGYTIAGSTTANLYQTSEAGVLSVLSDANFAGNTEIEFCITYRSA